MPFFVANWKMNKTRGEARAFAERLGARLSRGVSAGVELAVAPPFTALDAARDPQGRWSLAAPLFAGEPDRHIYGERGAVLARKLARAREANLTPIYCMGETEAERAEGATSDVLAAQAETLAGDPPDAPLVVAYEPVWAIGSGRAATPEDAGQARQEIARLLSGRRALRLLYGGSVNPGNAADLLRRSGMEGLLIGGASLSADDFAAIAGLP